ncbi:MAG: class I SAM-dependent methyltransferase [Pseudanabaena sp.]
MEYREYISKVKFSLIKPEYDVVYVNAIKRIVHILSRFDFKYSSNIDILITQLPEEEYFIKNILSEIADVPKMSTFAMGALINRGVSQIKPNSTFVNVGVWHGYTFLSGILNNFNVKCIGIDNFSEFNGSKESFLNNFNKYKSPNHSFYEMDYLEYFLKIHNEPIGFYIYDGEHSYENQLKGLEVAEPFFDDQCIILIDDTNWEDPYKSVMDFLKKRPNQYNILLDKRTKFAQHPTWWNGVIVLQKK